MDNVGVFKLDNVVLSRIHIFLFLNVIPLCDMTILYEIVKFGHETVLVIWSNEVEYGCLQGFECRRWDCYIC